MLIDILQLKIDDTHTDSLWYDGAIATSEHFTLYATGDIRIYRNATDTGEYLGMYDGKSRDEFGEIKGDEDIQRMYGDPNYNVDMNNWFEVVANDDNTSYCIGDTITGNYSEALDMLMSCEELNKESEVK